MIEENVEITLWITKHGSASGKIRNISRNERLFQISCLSFSGGQEGHKDNVPIS